MTQTRRSGPTTARPDTHHLPPILAPESDEWRERLAQRVAATAARRAARQALRAQLAQARAHGLVARHQAKLKRAGGERR